MVAPPEHALVQGVKTSHPQGKTTTTPQTITFWARLRYGGWPLIL